MSLIKVIYRLRFLGLARMHERAHVHEVMHHSCSHAYNVHHEHHHGPEEVMFATRERKRLVRQGEKGGAPSKYSTFVLHDHARLATDFRYRQEDS